MSGTSIIAKISMSLRQIALQEFNRPSESKVSSAKTKEKSQQRTVTYICSRLMFPYRCMTNGTLIK